MKGALVSWLLWFVVDVCNTDIKKLIPRYDKCLNDAMTTISKSRITSSVIVNKVLSGILGLILLSCEMFKIVRGRHRTYAPSYFHSQY